MSQLQFELFVFTVNLFKRRSAFVSTVFTLKVKYINFRYSLVHH